MTGARLTVLTSTFTEEHYIRLNQGQVWGRAFCSGPSWTGATLH